MFTSLRSAVAASYARLTGCLSGIFHIGNVSNLAYPASIPFLCSCYNCERHVAIFPLPGPGAVITTKGLSVSI